MFFIIQTEILENAKLIIIFNTGKRRQPEMMDLMAICRYGNFHVILHS